METVKFLENKEIENICEDIANWHKETFPDATEEMQIKKLNEECGELMQTGFSDLEEYADVFIVSATLWKRYEKDFGKTIIWLLVNNYGSFEMFATIKAKMEKNKKRNWNKINGVYRHKEQ